MCIQRIGNVDHQWQMLLADWELYTQRTALEMGVRQLEGRSVVEEGSVSGDLHSGSRACEEHDHSPDT